MVTTCSIVKGSFIDQDRQRGRDRGGEREQGDISAGPQLSDILAKAVLSILSPSIVAHKERRCFD